MGELPKVKIGRKTYYLDERLDEMRNVRDPHDRESMEGGSVDLYMELFGEHGENKRRYRNRWDRLKRG